MGNWKNGELGDFVTLKRGFDLPQQKREDGQVPIFSSSGITGTHSTAMVKAPGVITGRYGTIGEVFYAAKDFWPLNTTLFVEDFHGNDAKFIYYFLKTLEWSKFTSASAVPGINRNTVHKEIVSLPDIETQRRIASTLSMFDEKIKINTELNDNLADLLQTVYQDRFGNTSLVANQGFLSDICLYSRDKVAVSELNVSTYFSTENMLPGKAGSTEATSLPTTSQTTACHKGDTLISNIRPYFKKIVYCEDKCGCSPDVLCFTPSQPCYSAYLFSTLYADKFFAFMVAGSKGTKMPRGDKQQIMTYPVVLPSEEELAGFNTIASPLLEQIYSNRAENKRLSILRDTLLPKLMSGEIDVSDIQL